MSEGTELRDALDRAVHDAGAGEDLVAGALRRGRRRVRRRRAVAAAALVGAALLAVPAAHDLLGGGAAPVPTAAERPGMDPLQGTRGAEGCYPADLVVEPAEVSPGGVVTLSSPPAGCDLGYGEDARYTVDLVSEDGARTADVVSTPVAPDGSFVATVVVPDSTPLGGARLEVGPSAHDRPCGDLSPPGTTVDCVTYAALLDVARDAQLSDGVEEAGALLAARLGDGTRVAVAVPRADAGYPEAFVSGQLAVGANGCLVLDAGQGSDVPAYLVVLPAGTTVTADGTGLAVPGVGLVGVGDSVEGGGGYTEDGVLEGPLSACSGPVVSINPDLEVRPG